MIELLEKELFAEHPNKHALLELASIVSAGEPSALLYQILKHLNLKLFPQINRIEMMHTRMCNLACKYCFESGGHRKDKMSLRVSKNAIDFLFDYSGDESELNILHFGGEPMLAFNNVLQSTDYALELADKFHKNVSFDITSNGTLLSHDRCRALADRGVKVLISLDGTEKDNDINRVDRRGRPTFQRVIQNLNRLSKYQSRIGIKMTVTSNVVSRIAESVVQLHEMGVHYFNIGYATGVDWSEADIKEYHLQLESLREMVSKESDFYITELQPITDKAYYGCQAGRNSICIDTNGDINPCAKILTSKSDNVPLMLGNVSIGLYGLKNRLSLVQPEDLKTACERRGYSPYFGGCFATNQSENGDPFIPCNLDHMFAASKRLIMKNQVY